MDAIDQLSGNHNIIIRSGRILLHTLYFILQVDSSSIDDHK
jgi:hypothetical protein